MSEHFVPGYCALCRSRCGTLNEIIDGRLVSVCPDEDHPTGGAVCLKGKAAPELIYSEARVLWPLRRTREKGAADPGWKRISWDKALTESAEVGPQLSTVWSGLNVLCATTAALIPATALKYVTGIKIPPTLSLLAA